MIGDADAVVPAAVRQGFELVLCVVEAFCRPHPAPLLDGIDVAATAPGGHKQGEHDEASLQHDLRLVDTPARGRTRPTTQGRVFVVFPLRSKNWSKMFTKFSVLSVLLVCTNFEF